MGFDLIDCVISLFNRPPHAVDTTVYVLEIQTVQWTTFIPHI